MIGSVRKDEIDEIKKILELIKKEENNNPILEFGVYEGFSLSEIMLFLDENEMENKVYGFDGFVGMPYDEYHWKKKEAFSTKENTERLIGKKVGNIDRLTLIEGIYEDTIKVDIRERILDIDSASLIHLDCDLSLSMTHVLNVCKRVINKGTYIVFHDWGYIKTPYVWNNFASKNKINSKCFNISKRGRGNQEVFYIKNGIGEK